MTLQGQVHSGINNIFVVQADDGAVYQCRFKGKVLKAADGEYSPLAPGDRVLLEPDPHEDHKAQILDRLDRRNTFSRQNRKKGVPQVLAANIDRLVVITSTGSPPFRPRFLDRVLVQASVLNLEPLIVINKADLGLDPVDEDRLATFQDLGYDVILVSSVSGESMDDLAALLRGRVCVFIGQSGVGKSSLLNRLSPGAGRRIGELSTKYGKGAHTTTASLLVPWEGGGLIDTPGVREWELHGLEAPELTFHFREFAPYMGRCGFQPCSHRREPGCAVREALAAGEIHTDRYESYVRLYEELAERRPYA